MAGIDPSKYQDYVQGKISYEQAQTGYNAPKPTPAPASSGGGSSPWQSYSPPAMSQSYSQPPAPSTAKVNMPQYSAPSSYSGPASVIGNTSSFGSDMGKGYQNLFDTVQKSDPTRNQLNTWADSKTGNVYDTTKMTPQQIFALSLSKEGNPKATAILQGMGLDMNGNPTSYSNMPMSASQASSNQGMPSAVNYPSAASVNAPPPPAYTKNPEIDKLSRDEQLAYYASHPNDARNEIARSKDVWNSTSDATQRQGANEWANALRQAAGISMDDASYGNAQNGSSSGVYMPQQSPAGSTPTGQPAAAPPPNTSSTPAPYGQMSPDAIRAEAQARIAKQVTERSRIASQTKAGYQTSFDRMKQTTGEDRTLQDVAFQNNANPFSGKTTFDKGMTNLQRERTDRENQQDLQTRLGNVDIQLSDFLNQTPEMQQQIINDLTRQERAYGVDVANQTGYFNGQRNMAGQQMDWNMSPTNPNNAGQMLTNELTKLKIGNYPEEVKQASALFEQQLKSGAITLEQAQFKLKELQDPNSPTNQAAKIDLELKKIDLANAPQEAKLKIQQLQKQISNIGAAPYQSETDREYDRVKLETAKQQLEILKNPAAKPTSGNFNLDDYKGYINTNFYTQDFSGNKKFNSSGARSYIIGLGLPDTSTDQLLQLYGLPTN
jgi:hypothetical protein